MKGAQFPEVCFDIVTRTLASMIARVGEDYVAVEHLIQLREDSLFGRLADLVHGSLDALAHYG